MIRETILLNKLWFSHFTPCQKQGCFWIIGIQQKLEGILTLNYHGSIHKLVYRRNDSRTHFNYVSWFILRPTIESSITDQYIYILHIPIWIVNLTHINRKLTISDWQEFFFIGTTSHSNITYTTRQINECIFLIYTSIMIEKLTLLSIHSVFTDFRQQHNWTQWNRVSTGYCFQEMLIICRKR